MINLQGRVFMASNDDPFRTADQLLEKIKAKIIFVDFHAEATSEKIAPGLVSRWAGHGGGGHAYACTDGGRAGSSRRNGLHHRCGHDRAL